MALLAEAKAAMQWHAGRSPEAIDIFFNRQLHERILGRPLTELVPNTITIRLDTDVTIGEELWRLDQIEAFVPWHNRAEPKRLDIPLIIFRGWGKQCLIDGFNRRNFLAAQRPFESQRALVIQPLPSFCHPFPNAPTSRFFA